MSLISKAFDYLVSKASRGTLSNYVINSPPQYGQPMIVPGDASGLITPERMREIVRKTPTVAACLNAILDYTTNVPLLVRNVNPALPVSDYEAETVYDLLRRPNNVDSSRHWMTKLVTDLVVLGYAATEIEPNPYGFPANLYTLDGARLKIDFDEHGDVLGYNMLDIHGMPITAADGTHAWKPEQVVYFRRDAVSNSVYPNSRLIQLFSCAIIEDMMMAFIGGKFTESNIPYGIYDLGDISEQELRQAIASWNDQASSNHKILLTGSRGKSTWTEFGYALKDLEATKLLAEVRMKIMGILGVTMNELGESQDVNKSNGYNLSFTFKRRAIEPILTEITSGLTRWLIHDALGFKDIELYFDEIDSRDDLLQSQIDELNIKNGIVSINHVRNRRGLPSADGGDELYMVIGTNAVPVSLLKRFAEAQLAAIEAEIAVLQSGGVPGSVSPPALRGPQPPGKHNTPDGVGTSGFRINYPRPQQARGPTQMNRNAGLRPTQEVTR